VIVSASSRDRLTAAADILAITDAVAPGVQELAEDADATPSSEPWIDFNFWLARSIRSSAGARPIWFLNNLPDDAAPVDYLRAVADAAAGGARWVVSAGDQLRHGLRTNDAEAKATWREIAAFLRFQQEHRDWFDYAALAVSGFLQDSSASDRDVPGEYLKLLIRRGIPVRVIERSRLNAAALEGLTALHAIDLARPTADERKLLTAFAETGGVLVVGPSWGPVEIPEDQEYASTTSGKGRVLVFQEGADPGELARTLVDALGRDKMNVRLFRGASVLSQGSTSDAEKTVLIHLLNYASYPADSLLVRVDGAFRAVRLYTPGRAPEPLPLEASGGRAEVTVPRLPVYGVLRFER
jgi:hypothetical protein